MIGVRLGKYAFALSFLFFACNANREQKEHQPKLVVLITVDQLGLNLINEYRPFLKGGIARIIKEGETARRTTVDHAITNSLPGHTSITTGMYPCNHGISDNVWTEYTNGELHIIQPLNSDTAKVLGHDSLLSFSPDFIRSKSLPQIILEESPNAKVAVTGSGRAAALHMGKVKGNCLWYDPRVGEYITSTYFSNNYPAWLHGFNADLQQRMKIDTIWKVSFAHNLNLELIDEREFENGGDNFQFPHYPRKELISNWYDGVPFLDQSTTQLAMRALEEMNFGKDSVTDFLSLSYSVIDHIGHTYGPKSLEQFEALMSLDQSIASLLYFLDRQIGKGDYAVVLTADHGVGIAPEQLQGEGKKSFRVSSKQMENLFKQLDSLDQLKIENKEERIIKFLEQKPFIERVFSQKELRRKVQGDSILKWYQNSLSSNHIPVFPLMAKGWKEFAMQKLVVMFAPFTSSYLATSIHGTPYSYDREVPIYFFGNQLKLINVNEAHTIDIAPSIVKLMNLEGNHDFDGKPLI